MPGRRGPRRHEEMATNGTRHSERRQEGGMVIGHDGIDDGGRDGQADTRRQRRERMGHEGHEGRGGHEGIRNAGQEGGMAIGHDGLDDSGHDGQAEPDHDGHKDMGHEAHGDHEEACDGEAVGHEVSDRGGHEATRRGLHRAVGWSDRVSQETADGSRGGGKVPPETRHRMVAEAWAPKGPCGARRCSGEPAACPTAPSR